MGELSVSIGRRIKELRKMCGLTQGELAKKVGLSAMSIRRYEKAERDIDFNTWMKIALILGLSKEDATLYFLSDQSQDFQVVKDLARVENTFHAKGIELLEIYFDLSEEGQKRVLSYARDMQAIYGGELAKIDTPEYPDSIPWFADYAKPDEQEE